MTGLNSRACALSKYMLKKLQEFDLFTLSRNNSSQKLALPADGSSPCNNKKIQ